MQLFGPVLNEFNVKLNDSEARYVRIWAQKEMDLSVKLDWSPNAQFGMTEFAVTKKKVRAV